MQVLSFSGRIGRSDYFAAKALIYIAFVVCAVLIAVGGPNADKDFPTEDVPQVLRVVAMPSALGWTVLLAGMGGFLVAILVALSISVRRLHDFGLTGFLVLLVPLIAQLMPNLHWPEMLPGPVGLLWDLIMIAQPGTRGSNPFGPDPREPPTEASTPDPGEVV